MRDNGRTCEHVASLRVVATSDFMTADSAELPCARLKKVSSPPHQRGARHQPRGLRSELQAACHHRVGVMLRRSVMPPSQRGTKVWRARRGRHPD